MVYTTQYYATRTMLESTETVGKIVLEAVPAKKMIDFGCGPGEWLNAFQQLGVSEIMGVDGDYVDREHLYIPVDTFFPHDLTKPFVTDRTFDLAICLEVGEHLPTPASSVLVQSIVNTAPVVMFSAAVPYQGGTAHCNEQWPSFWAEIFARHDYVPVDYVRPRIWANDNVAYFYRQNIVMYVHKDKLSNYPLLQAEAGLVRDYGQLNLVHPAMLTTIHWRRAFKLFRHSVGNGVNKRLGKDLL